MFQKKKKELTNASSSLSDPQIAKHSPVCVRIKSLRARVFVPANFHEKRLMWVFIEDLRRRPGVGGNFARDAVFTVECARRAGVILQLRAPLLFLLLLFAEKGAMSGGSECQMLLC